MNISLAFPTGPFNHPLGSNPYYDPEALEIWRGRITRLRTLADMPAPWEVEPNADHWKRSLGRDDFLDSVMLEWKVWMHSLTPNQRSAYEVLHPEPDGFGFYQLIFERPIASQVPEDRGADAYWDSLEKHYEAVFGVA